MLPVMSEDDPRRELALLVSAFRAHLAWRGERGVLGYPAGPSPRSAGAVGPATPLPVENALVAPVASVTPEPAPAESLPTSPRRSPHRGARSAKSESAGASAELLAEVRRDLGDCRRCPLHKSRSTIVFGEGNPRADVMFIGEAPGREEDEQGLPFVGTAGQLLTKMIEAMGLSRDEIYIANVIKCRPKENRDPTPDEIATCEPFLRRQIAAVQPRLLIALGNFAAKTLLRTEVGITKLRGRFHSYQGAPLMPTFHPAHLLRHPDAKRASWQDLQRVMAEMDRLGLPRRRKGP
jgi:uracil-DNA glycosylase